MQACKQNLHLSKITTSTTGKTSTDQDSKTPEPTNPVETCREKLLSGHFLILIKRTLRLLVSQPTCLLRALIWSWGGPCARPLLMRNTLPGPQRMLPCHTCDCVLEELKMRAEDGRGRTSPPVGVVWNQKDFSGVTEILTTLKVRIKMCVNTVCPFITKQVMPDFYLVFVLIEIFLH